VASERRVHRGCIPAGPPGLIAGFADFAWVAMLSAVLDVDRIARIFS